MIKNRLKKILNLREEMSFSFYVIDFIFRKLLRQNIRTKWAVHHTSTIQCPEKIKRGIGVWPGDSPNVYINAFNGISFGDYVNIGPNTCIVSANHDLIDNKKLLSARPIEIHRFCWVGANVTILPEVILGDFTVVGAGAVVTKSFKEGYCIIAGNPAAIVRYLDKQSCDTFARSVY